MHKIYNSVSEMTGRAGMTGKKHHKRLRWISMAIRMCSTLSTHGESGCADRQAERPVNMRKISKRLCMNWSRSGLMFLCRIAFTDADVLR